MSEFPARRIVVSLPLTVYEALAALGEGDPVEEVAASLLTGVVRLGAPGDLHAAIRLAAEMADLQADRWQQRRGELTQLHAELQRIVEALVRSVVAGCETRKASAFTLPAWAGARSIPRKPANSD